jgi:transcriptional regulator with XRE-family HTH domain
MSSPRFASSFSRLIRSRRLQIGKTQGQVADGVGVTSDCIALGERGHRRLELDRIPALADDALDIDRNILCQHALEVRAPQLYKELVWEVM